MKCDEARKTLPLLLYGELSFEEEERLEVHIDECDGCREAMARERELFQSLDDAELAPSAELLARCRSEFSGRLASARPEQASFWNKLRDGFSIHFHFAPGYAQLAGAVALLLIGFFGARMTPGIGRGPLSAADVAGAAATSRVRYVEPVGPGKVQIVLDETTQRTLSGSIDDEKIRRWLVTAAKDPSDVGLRVESVDLLKNQPQSAEVRRALLYAVQHDPNAGVRLKALDGLRGFADDPETQQALLNVLVKDECAGVRTQVIDLLVQHHAPSMVGVLQEVMGKENNGYVRMGCQRALHEMNASAESY